MYSKVRYLITMLGNLFSSVLTAKGLRTARCKSTDGLAPCMGIPKQAIQPTKQISQAFKVGSPIRISMDQSSFAAPHGFSQRITSFIACACQGIHQLPLRHLIVLIVYAHHLAVIPKECGGQGYLLQPKPTQRCHRRVRQICFIGATPSGSLAVRH